MKQLVLTGLGNEVDLKSGRAIFTAVFNDSVRIEISKDAAQTLTSAIYSGNGATAPKAQAAPQSDYDAPPIEEEQEAEGEEFGGNGAPVLEDAPSSVYDNDTGIEQV